MSELSLQSIPNKLYFRIGEVSDIVGVKPYVLRYWESEFPDIKPSKSKSGQRLYKRRDVETLLAIRQLLYEERFTINGARKRLKDRIKNGKPSFAVESEIEHVVQRVEETIPEVVEKRVESVAQVTEPVLAKKVEEPARVVVSPGDRQKLLLKVRKDLETLLKIVQEDI